MNKSGRIILAFLATAGCAHAQTGVTDTEIRIGDISVLSGPASWIGQAFASGTKLAAAEVNSQGGINGRKLVVLQEDDGGVAARGYQAAKKLIEQDQVFALNGTSGSASVMAMMPIIEQHGIPAIVSWAPNERVYDPVRPTVFTIGANYSEAFYVTLKYIHENREPKNPVYGGIFHDDEFGASIRAGYDRAVKEFKVKDGLRLTGKRTQMDFGTEALQLNQAGVNVFVNGNVLGAAASMETSLRKLGVKPEIASVYSELSPEAIKLHKTAGYKYLTSDYVADVNEEAGKALIERAKKYLTPAEVSGINRYTFVSYVAMKAFIEAAGKCGKNLTRACHVENLRKIRNLDTGGISAPLSFDNPKQRAGYDLKVYEIDAAASSVKALTGFVKPQ